MRNSISKAVAKLAAAALVAAGGVGTVWAQSPITSPTVTEQGDNKMSVTYTVEQTAEIEVTPNNPTAEQFIGFDPEWSSLDGTDGRNGNLGTVRVKTNSRGWDVTFTTVNGGKLAKVDVVYDTTSVLIPGEFPPKYRDSIGAQYGAPKYLLYRENTGLTKGVQKGLTTSDADTLRLDVGIGMLERVGGVNYLKGYPNGLSTRYNTPLVDSLELNGSQTLSAAGVVTSGTGVSFAKTVGNGSAIAATQGTLTALGATRVLKVGGVTVGSAAGTTAAVGFGPTKTALTGLPGVTKDDESEYFFVNVGVPTENEAELAGNDKGDYSETFTFTLIANF